MSAAVPGPAIVVTAAVVKRDDHYLVTRRPEYAHLAGYWEFPGGKCEPGESHEDCLRREIREELDTEARVHGEIFAVTHAYEERVVELHFFRCTLAGTPQPVLGQEMRWVARDELAALKFPPADAELIRRLQEGLF